jgi:hypothetical protein
MRRPMAAFGARERAERCPLDKLDMRKIKEVA